jgi:NifU-like protein involved in Fe-S cluster formation
MNAPLYNAEILRLAASLAGQSRLADPQLTVEKRSPTCGSRVTVDLVVEDDQVVAFGQEVRACALGQAGAALLGQNVIGSDRAAIASAAADLRAYLAGTRDDPGSWPGLEIFAPARPHRARHASILLAFDAAAEAITMKHAKA